MLTRDALSIIALEQSPPRPPTVEAELARLGRIAIAARDVLNVAIAENWHSRPVIRRLAEALNS